MFVLVKISDVVQIEPREFTELSGHCIEEKILRKYANRVIQRVGLCICLWDIVSTSEGLISQSSNSGRVNVNVDFRLVVFRPFKGEILQAVVLDHSEAGIRLGLDFFSDIWVPAESLFDGSQFKFRDDGHVWIWETDDGQEYFYDRSEIVRFRVEEEAWNDHAHTLPPGEVDEDDGGGENAADGAGGGAEPEGVIDPDDEDAIEAERMRKLRLKDVPYTIIGSMGTAGLGPLFWWSEDSEEEEEQVAEDEPAGMHPDRRAMLEGNAG